MSTQPLNNSTPFPALLRRRSSIAFGMSVALGGGAGDGIAAMLYNAPFAADLTKSLLLRRGSGDPTYTRATPATVKDNEGVLRTVPSGCARFEGVRYVRNLAVVSSENFGLAAFNTVNGGNSGTAGQITFAGGAGTYILQNGPAVGLVPGRTYIVSAYITKGTKDGSLYIGSQSNAFYETVTPTTTRTRYSVVFTATTANPYCGFVNADANTGTVVVDGYMVEDITGRTDQTTPSEYVSVGVLSAPYHGAGVDGVKYFDTTLAGVPIPSSTLKGYLSEGSRQNICLQSNAFTTTWGAVGTPAATQNVVGPDGGTTAWTLTDDSAVAWEGISQGITLTAATYTISLFVKKTIGVQASYPVIYTDDAVSKSASCTIDTTNGVATVWTAYTDNTVVTSSASCVSHNDNYWRVSLTLLATAATWNVYLIPAGTTNATQSTGVIAVAAQGSAVFYGAQVELGSFASTYIPTTTVAVTRNADVLTYPSSGNVLGTSGWCYAEIYRAASYSLGGDAAIVGSGANSVLSVVRAGNLAIYDGTAYRSFNALTASQSLKVATEWAGSASSGAIGGVVASSGFDGDIGVSTNIETGSYNSLNQFFGTIRNVRIGQVALTAATLGDITS